MITIRTGGNGSYKSAYVAYFTILPALVAGRIVVTNFEGMEPLHVIEERLGIKFPSTSRLIRIFSRNPDGINLWQHFYCWAPLNSHIVIDECQDLFSKNIGFDMKKNKAAPLSDFLPFLPSGFEDLFNSRHVPSNMDDLKECEVDDCGKAEFDEDGKIIYPFSFNEGFMRHRKYNWDIDLISPDWKQIDSSIKACAEQAFFHKSRDGFVGAKRKPYIYKHSTEDSTIKLPKKKDGGLVTLKIPIEAHLLYKSTNTGSITKSGGTNLLFKNPMFWACIILIIFCIGYFTYGVTNLLYNDDSEIKEVKVETQNTSTVSQSQLEINESNEINNDVSVSRDNNQSLGQVNNGYVHISQVLYFEGIETAFISAINKKVIRKNNTISVRTNLLLNVQTNNGVYSVNENYLLAVGAKYKILDECLLEISNDTAKSLVTCGAVGTRSSSSSDTDLPATSDKVNDPNVKSLVKDNSIFL